MREKINEEVSVIMSYSSKKREAMPRLLSWQNREYHIEKIDYQHTVKDGTIIHHIYEFTDKQGQLWFRLNLDSSNLHWKLEAISDGNAD
jgi:hypothetical protein